MPGGRRVLLVAQGNPSFVERDAELLARHYEVERFRWRGFRDAFALRRAVRRSDAVVSWFAEAHAAVAVRAAGPRRTVTIVGGYDVLAIPELRYGVPLRRFPMPQLARYALRHSDAVLAVDPILIDAARTNLGVATSNFEYLPTGYDAAYWSPDASVPKDGTVLTVAGVDRTTIGRKGLRRFCEVARLLPQVRFRVVGALLDETAMRLKAEAPPNVAFTGRVGQTELLAEYRRASVYAQFSVAEGLPNALCEAMLCGCVPVGTIAGGIPHAIDDAGFLCADPSPPALAARVREALASPEKGAAARARVARLFRLDARERGLVAAIEGRPPGQG